MANLQLFETAALIAVPFILLCLYAKHRNGKENPTHYVQGNLLSAHFLMNALNVLPQTIEKDSLKAFRYSQTLSSVLKHYIKYANQSSISLQQELDMLGKYAYLLGEIYGNNIKLDIDISNAISHKVEDYRIVPMSIQLAVENAVKHNHSTKVNTLSIHVSIDEDGVCVSNNKSHLQKVALEECTGMGLHYLRNKTMAIIQQPLLIKETRSCYSIHFPITKQTCPDEYPFDRRRHPISQGTKRTPVAV